MYRPLSPCPSCQRHVLASASACPFCNTVLEAKHVVAAPIRRMSRAAAAALGASLALTACGGGKPTPSDPVVKPEPPDDPGAPMAKYGAPPPPEPGAKKPAKPEPSPPDDSGAIMAEYGAPAPKPPLVGPGPDDGGGMVAKYGAPPPPDVPRPKK